MLRTVSSSESVPRPICDIYQCWRRYVDQATAESQGLISSSATNVRIGVDDVNVYPPGGPGRPSIRISSKASWTHALYILDLEHMPTGCGTWPAFWSLGPPTWPNNGEIDIIEAWNLNTENTMTLHTDANCTTAGFYETGTLLLDNCDSTNPPHSGCSVQDTRTSSVGVGLNAVGGGVYAMEWTSYFIRVWWFPRSSIPACIHQGRPDPNEFGPAVNVFEIPAANFMSYPNASCDIDAHFVNHNIIINTDFCGDLSGTDYGNTTCPQVANTNSTYSCTYFVGYNPTAFTDAYWLINSLKVYQQQAHPAYIGPYPTAQLPATPPFVGWSAPGLGRGPMNAPAPPISIGTQTTIPASAITSTYAGPNTWTGRVYKARATDGA
jgi:Glycosyl hydrolases family 16